LQKPGFAIRFAEDGATRAAVDNIRSEKLRGPAHPLRLIRSAANTVFLSFS